MGSSTSTLKLYGTYDILSGPTRSHPELVKLSPKESDLADLYEQYIKAWFYSCYRESITIRTKNHEAISKIVWVQKYNCEHFFVMHEGQLFRVKLSINPVSKQDKAPLLSRHILNTLYTFRSRNLFDRKNLYVHNNIDGTTTFKVARFDTLTLESYFVQYNPTIPAIIDIMRQVCQACSLLRSHDNTRWFFPDFIGVQQTHPQVQISINANESHLSLCPISGPEQYDSEAIMSREPEDVWYFGVYMHKIIFGKFLTLKSYDKQGYRDMIASATEQINVSLQKQI